MKKISIIIIQILFVIGILSFYKTQIAVYAQNLNPTVSQTQTYYTGVIRSFTGSGQSKRAQVEVTVGDKKGAILAVSTPADARSSESRYTTGDKVIVLRSEVANQPALLYIVDFVRTDQILLLTALFVVVVVVVAGTHGFLALLGLLYSFLIIGRFVVPNIIAGNDPIFVSLLAGLLISPVTFYISHGFNRKTTVAVVATLATLAFTGILSVIFVHAAKLTGVTSDEALYVQSQVNGDINLKSLLLASMIIGTLGILDDITVSQASIVDKLVKTGKDLSFPELFKHAMDVGKDHIASLVNTLMLVYAGASLPLFLLFSHSNLGYSVAISSEIVATELVRTLIGSIGLVAAVPLTTFLACHVLKKNG